MLKYIGDFERLKEFGFKKQRNCYKKICYMAGYNTVLITVDSRKTAKKLGTYRYIYGIYFYSNDEMIETLIDLIKANLVEKVVKE